MIRFFWVIYLLIIAVPCSHAQQSKIKVGAQRTELYLPMLKGKKVGVLTNNTGMIGQTHLVDSLCRLGVDVRVVFAPEHGFRGEADAGEKVGSSKDAKTGVEIVSIYGANKIPKDKDVKALDVVVFDIQDVGLRYYTYLSSMHYMMQAAARNGVPMIVLDRPNPNGFYVDGPILEPAKRSFVGMHPIPTVHGMTLGELAQMINGEGWLSEGLPSDAPQPKGLRCDITVVKCDNYTHQSLYELPVKPSPNLPNMRSVYLYSSLCFLEGTPVSLGRGTEFPFQVYGHPRLQGDFRFTPKSMPGAKNPPLMNQPCRGVDLRRNPSDEQIRMRGVDLSYVVDCYRELGGGEKFFLPIFDLLTGTTYVREMIIAGKSADQIEARWQNDVEKFKQKRKKYLLYEE